MKVLPPRGEQCIVIDGGNAKEGVYLETPVKNLRKNFQNLQYNGKESTETVAEESLLTIPNTDGQESIVRQCQQGIWDIN